MPPNIPAAPSTESLATFEISFIKEPIDLKIAIPADAP